MADHREKIRGVILCVIGIKLGECLGNCPVGWSGSTCSEQLLCRNCLSRDYDVTEEGSGKCALGWDGPTCSRRNVALNQSTTQSSNYSECEIGFVSMLAVDGRTGHQFYNKPCTCTHTRINPQPAFWTVTLDAQYNIYRFRIYNRKCEGECADRLNSFTLSVGNSSQKYKLCYQDNTTNKSGPGDIIDGVCKGGPVFGDTVKITLDTRRHLTLCEVQIFVCAPGTYGPVCEKKCGNCSEGSSDCDTISGLCPERTPRCMAGYLGEKCDRACDPGTYGADCGKRCGNCTDGPLVCNTASGLCPEKTPRCMPGYSPSKCDTVCRLHTWGSDCLEDCGHCYNGSQCDVITGECPVVMGNPGCDHGYSQGDCKTREIVSDGSEIDRAYIGGGLAAGVALVAIVVVALVIVRRGRREVPRPDDLDLQTERGIFQADNAEPQDNIAFGDDSDSQEDEPQVDVNPYVNADVVPTTVSVDEFPDYFVRRNAGKGFKKEFESFPVGLQAQHTEADKPKNKAKSRYRSLVAYDHSRVLLSVTDDQDTDYINACYINGYNEPKKYIASQGPNDVILNDFLRMVWEQKSGKIVMVTNLVETTKTKCRQYWPDEGSKSFGQITVTLLDEENYADFTVRTLQLAHIKRKKESHTVKQFHFRAWPDHSVPGQATALLDFGRKVNGCQTQMTGPIVVHCSAGVGRTGTYIALDYLIAQAHDEGVVDVPACVRQLREQRVNMVQTLDQYTFLHEALAEALKLRCSSISGAEFHRVFAELCSPDPETGRTKMAEQFQSLQRLTAPLDKTVLTAARHPENVSKNRSDRILAADTCRPYLSTPVPDGNNYINAVYLPTFQSKRGLIITQTPLPGTVLDFWRLVYDHSITTIVMLDVVKPDDTDFGIYWPMEGERFDPFVVKVKDKQEHEGFAVWTYHLSHKDTKGAHPIKQFRCKFWAADPTPSSIPSLLSVMQAATKWQEKTGNVPILVHCRDGVTKSGLFCVATSVIERLKVDHEVNIVHSVKEMRTNRPQIITDLNQFHFLHQVAMGYLETVHTYANYK